MNLLEIVSRWVADTKPIDQAIDATATKAETRMGKIGGVVQAGMGAGAKTLAAGGALLFGAAAKGAIDLQNATLDFQAATGATAEEAEAAGQSINRLFQDNLTTMGEASGVLAALKTDMGLTGDAAEVAAGQILDFAKVTGQDAVGAVAALDDLTDIYGLNIEQQAGILDQLVASQQKYGGSVEANQAALAKLGPSLQAANLSYDDGIGLLNLFAASGVDAAKAPAALTKALTKVKSPEELQKLIDDISATEDPFLRAQKATDLFGAKAGAGLAQALSNGSLEDFIVTMDEAAGATATASDTIDSKLGNQVTLALNKVRGALAGFGSELGPAVTGLASLASLGAPMVKGLLGGLLPALGGIVAPLAAGVSGLFAAAIPIALAALPVLIVAGVVAAIVFLANNPQVVDEIIKFAEGLVQTIVDALGQLPALIAGVLGALPGLLADLVPKVLAVFATIGGRLVQAAIDLVGHLVSIFFQLPGMLVGMIGAWVGLWSRLALLVRGKIVALAGQVVAFILSIPGRIAGLVGQVAAVATRLAAGVRTRIVTLITQVVGFFLAMPGRIAAWVTTIIGQVTRLASTLVSKVTGLVGSIVRFFLSIPGRIASIGGRIVSGIIGGMASLPGRLADTIRRAFANLRIDIGPFHISSSGVRIDLPKIDLPSFDVGSSFVPADMLAMVHKGEIIIPAAEADAIRAGRMSIGSGADRGDPVTAAGGDTYNVNVQGALPVRTIRDVSVELQRVQRLGKVPRKHIPTTYPRREATVG